MRLSTEKMTLHPRRTFQISRARRTHVDNVLVRITDGEMTGLGEASPNEFYDESADAVMAKLRDLNPDQWRVESPEDIARIWEESWPVLAPSRAAQCAADVALWDLLGKRRGQSVSELLWARPPEPVLTSCTIGLSSPEELAGQLEDLAGFPLLKVKAGSEPDLERLRQIRERTGARIVVDANCAWGVGVDIPALTRELAALGVEFLEQPLPPDQLDRMPAIRETSVLPLVADENCVVREDVPRLAGAFDGINIKLVKCGGITPARAMLAEARARGMKTMIGCMLESSCLIAAGFALAQQTDYADLDGAWLLADDPFRGLGCERGKLELDQNDAPGLGITR